MSSNELRCKNCKILLGISDKDGITVQRGGMQATFPDAHTAVIVCYKCTKINFFTIIDDSKGGTGRRSA